MGLGRWAKWGWETARRWCAGEGRGSRRSAAGRRSKWWKRQTFRRLASEPLESRALLAADYLYELAPRPGAPIDGVGAAVAVNEQFHVVANFAPYVSPYFLEQYPDFYQSRYYGEIQVHDAATGELLRTIENPLPYGHPYLSNFGGFNNAYITPNAFGFSIDIEGSLILVGSPGWEGKFLTGEDADERDSGGRAFLFDATTGDLLHTLDGSFYPTDTFGRNNDGFGRSVAIEGNVIAIAAPGPSYEDGESNIFDSDPGRVYLYNATTGALLNVLESSDPSPPEDLDFGSSVSLSDGKLAVTQGYGEMGPAGPTLIYDVATGDLLRTLNVNGGRAILAGNNLALLAEPGALLVNATSGVVTESIAAPLLGFDGELLLTADVGPEESLALEVRDFPSGDYLYSVALPPGNTHHGWDVYRPPQVFADRLLVPGRRGAANESVVFVYSVTPGSDNGPPTNVTLSNSSIAENSSVGTVVGTFATTDPDSPEIFTYVLLDSSGGRFAIVDNQLIVDGGINFETSPSAQITVQVTDSAGHAYAKDLTITVIDVPEPPVNLTLADHYVREGAADGTLVSWIDNVDPQVNGSTDSFAQNIVAGGGRVVYANLGKENVIVTDESTGDLLRLIANPTPSETGFDFFGDALALSGDWLVVGAPSDDGDAIGAGAAYVFDIETGQLLHTLRHPSPSVNAKFGWDVSIHESRIVVGARGDESAFLFSALTGELLYSWSGVAPFFGSAVQVTAEYVVVGAFGAAGGAGRVFVYDLANGSLVRTLNNPHPAHSGSVNDGFGVDVVVVGDQVVVGAHGEDAFAEDAGAAYAFDLTNGNLLATLLPSSSDPGDRFAISLAAREGFLAVGRGASNGIVELFATATWQSIGEINTGVTPSGFGLTFVDEGLIVGVSPSSSRDRAEVYRLLSQQRRSAFRVLNPGVPQSFTFSLVDDAGGRFAIDGNQLLVADGSLLDADSAASHTVVVRVTNSQGLWLEKSLVVDVLANNEPPTSIELSDASVPESTSRWIHNPQPELNRLVGTTLASGGGRLLVADFDAASPGTRPGRVAVIDSATGQTLRTLVHPNPLPDANSADGVFGSAAAIAGNLAVVSAIETPIGGQAFSGMVFVFDLTTGAVVHTLTSPSANPSLFGASVAAFGNLLAIGASDSGGAVYLYDLGAGALVETIVNPNPGLFDAFGHQLAWQGASLVVGAPEEQMGASAVGRAYLYSIDAGTGQATLVATLDNPSPDALDRFGVSVAVAGEFVAVASQDDEGADGAGVVYIYDSANGDLLHTIPHPAPSANDGMGRSLGFQGKFLIAGSRASQSGGAGRVDVFAADTGHLVATLENPSPDPLDEFGTAITVDGSRLIVSAWRESADGPNAGMTYVFQLPFGETVGTLSATDADPGETFTYKLTNDAGGRFALVGDQVVIADATQLDYEAATSHGIVVQAQDSAGNKFSQLLTISVVPANEPPRDLQLSTNLTSESQTRFIHNPEASLAPFSTLGFGAEVSGNLLLVGNRTLSSSATFGIASVFDRETGGLLTTLRSPSPELGDGFGVRVAISGTTAVVAAPLKTVVAGAGLGEVHVFDALTGAVRFTLANPDPVGLRNFGAALALDGDLLAVAARPEFSSPALPQVFLFSATTGVLLGTIANANFAFFDNFAPATNLRVQGDTIVVGGPVAGAGNQGRAYVYHYDSATHSATLTHTLSPPSATQLFGIKLDLQGDTLAVAAPHDNTLALQTGRVFLYDVGSGALLLTIDNPTPNANDNFGSALALFGESLFVSATGDDATGSDSGVVYQFDWATGTLRNVVHNPTPNAFDNFGAVVTIAGNQLIVNARNDNADGTATGMVYLFESMATQVVGELVGSDPDPSDVLTYSLIDDADGRFRLEGTSLIVVDPLRLDHELAPSHDLRVQVTDASGLSTFETLKILVANVNEPPVDIEFSGSAVSEMAAVGTVVSTLNTVDPDGAGAITYSLEENAGGRFGIVGNTIVVASGAPLDYETGSSHLVVVRATDSGGKFVRETRQITLLNINEGTDFGDLPNSYRTLLASNGARHTLSNGLRLGTSVTSESNGSPSPTASGDAGDDGVTFASTLIAGMRAQFTVTASHAGRLDAFFDFNVNGVFTESERITPAGGFPLSPGANLYSIAIPSGISSANCGVRFRISTVGGLGAVGLAADGEVEDYRVSVISPASNFVGVIPDPESPSQNLMLVGGTTGKDTMVVAPFNGQLRATINGVPHATLAPLSVSRIVIFGKNGNDDLRIDGTYIPGFIDGGSGKDTIRGGLGPDILHGRADSDVLYGRDGDDTLYGGTGNDVLHSDAGFGHEFLFGEEGHDTLYGNGYLMAGSGNDTLQGSGILVGGSGHDALHGEGARNLLIGGSGKDELFGANVNQGDLIVAMETSYDNNLTALRAIHDEWKRGTPVLPRIANLTGATPGGLNGPFVLAAATLVADTRIDSIFNHGSLDATLDDWIFKSSSDLKLSPWGIVVTFGS